MKCISDNGEMRLYQLGDGRVVHIEIDDGAEMVSVADGSGDPIGGIRYRENGDRSVFLTWMYLDGLGRSYLRCGIGKAALEFMKDYLDVEICAADNDGITRDDGGHLTADAPSFIDKMRELGIVRPGHYWHED